MEGQGRKMERPEPERQRMEEMVTYWPETLSEGLESERRSIFRMRQWTERPVTEGRRMKAKRRMRAKRRMLIQMGRQTTPPMETEWQKTERGRASPMEDERQRPIEERRAERMEAERCIEAERRCIEAERRRVVVELRRMQPERRRRKGEILLRSRREREVMALSRRMEREAMGKEVMKAEAQAERMKSPREVEAKWKVTMEKAEAQAERMKSPRQVPKRRWRRRIEMDEDRMEEAKRVELELKRKAKRAELELERVMDDQRMEAEVAELEMLLAKFEGENMEMKAEMEAEKKRVDEGIRIFQVWWDAWLQAQKQEACNEEDREWVKTFSVRWPLASMAVWRAWESDEEDLFIELYDSVCGQKLKELRLNSWKKVEFCKKVFQQELEDVELMTYCRKYIDFRNCWENKYSYQHGQFEDITTKRCMYYSCGPVPRLMFEGPRPRTLQVFSVKIGGSNSPLQVYGLIAVRDFVGPQRNMIFNRDRDECQIVTKEDPYLPLTGPTRSVVVDMNESMGPITIEAELKVRGAMESEDKYIIVDAISLPTLVGSRPFELGGPYMKLEILLGSVQRSVEATIFIRLIDGTWPSGFHGQFVAKTASIECNEVILLEFSGDGEMKQSRSVMSVESSGILIVTLKAWRGEEVGSVIFNAVSRGISSGTLNLGSCSVQVHVVWSLISPYCEELAPPGSKELFNF